MDHPFHLHYQDQAHAWRDALPLGNGRLGAMVYGHTGVERIQLNDDSLWYGLWMDRNNPSLKDKLPEIRQLVLTGDIRRAEELILQHMAGAPAGMRHYTSLGELDIALNQHLPFTMGWLPSSEGCEAYECDLDLMDGTLMISHRQDGVLYRREMFVSHPAQVMCLRLTSDVPQAINLDVMMNRISISDAVNMDDRRPGRRVSGGGWPAPLADSIRTVDDRTILMSGQEAGVAFAAAVRMICNGRLVNPISQLLARDSSEVLLLLASATSNRSADPATEVLHRLDEAERRGYSALRQEHTTDFAALMGRCLLDLGPSPDQPTDKRLAAVRAGEEDPALAALYFQFGRYLLVAGSREGSTALNLQGIWNADFTPMWDSKYTTNINVQMNYWPAEVCNLSDLHLPLMDLLESVRDKGSETARVMYGMRGLVCHHNTDLYGDCAPQDPYLASMPWTTGGPWLGLHIWEHFLFTRDEAFLARMYPFMRDAALFFVDFLMERDGKLVTCPAVSPENRYILPDGYDTPVCAGPAMDNQILREYFAACIEAQRLLGVDQELAETLANMAARLPEDQVGSQGQLLEWDQEYPELTPGMSHISHLFACHPGSSINWRDTPALMEAVRKSLDLRVANGAGRNGWPLAWYINVYARLQDRAMTDSNIRQMLAHSAARNLLNAGFVFQIDGNLGAVAGIAECLLQSHLALHFLPALPESWRDGRVQGLKARGAIEVDLQWKGGQLVKATLRPQYDGPVEVIGETLRVACRGVTIEPEKTAIGFRFAATGGSEYELVPHA